jgi:TrmH family RNA methyltransferase
MKTMGLSRLVLVRPQGFPCAEATARASGADDLLCAARVVDDLAAAIEDCGLVVGTSARQRTLAWPEVEPRTAARLLLDCAAVAPAAVVFGRERWGLSNLDLERCQYLLRIPTNPSFSSLNLAAAVQLVAYELWVAAGERGTVPAAGAGAESRPGTSAARGSPATAADLQGLLEHLEDTAVELGFLDPAQPKRFVRRMWRLFHRARPDRTEINILRGLLKAAQQVARRRVAAATTPRDPRQDEPGTGA